jgi:hypothetical protein
MRCLIVVAVMFVVAACAPAGTPTPRSSSAPSSPAASATPTIGHTGPQLVGKLSVGGQFAASADFTAPADIEVGGIQTPAPSGTTCAAYAQGYPNDATHGGGVGFDSPGPQTTGTTAMPGVYLAVSLPTGYHGPGTYSGRSIAALSGAATVAVETAQGPAYSVFHSRGGDTTLTVASDGSGSVTFSRWANDETRAGNGTGDLNGVMTWSCR